MEWYEDYACGSDAKVDTDRVLAITSGNAQSSSYGSKQGARQRGMHATGAGYAPLCPSSNQYPAPRTTLRSNDRRSLHRQKLAARKLKRRYRLAQAYLQHPKFLAFRTRSRKDIDKHTREIIWDDETEAAFQNALINIPAIGRKKKSQHGKTLGRNELIAEWIKQETGKERSRKQVSSHMQTLDNVFKSKMDEGFEGIPEWRMITKPPRKGEDPFDHDGLDFYDNSIADMVRHWKSIQVDLTEPHSDVQPLVLSHDPMSDIDINEINTLSRLDFEMWVSLPERMEIDNALHRYTCIQSSQPSAAPEPLENIQAWRNNWPELVPLIEHPSPSASFDIVLLHASYELMLDFPPPRSKLGIGLELEFDTSALHAQNQPGALSWSCTTHIYQRGQLEVKARHNNCLSTAPGRVKPPFESKWWAAQFTRLTEKRRLAVDSDNEAAIAAADEASRNYLNNLRMMQQIFTSPKPTSRYDVASDDHSVEGKRVAILLWTFSKSTSDFVGTTTWRRLVLPPTRITTNSPMPDPQEMALPPLSMDTTIESGFDDNIFEPHDGFIPHQINVSNRAYTDGTDDDEELCQDGCLTMAHTSNMASLMIPYPDSSTFEALNHNHQAFRYNMQETIEQGSSYQLSFADNSNGGFSDHFLEAHDRLQFVPPPALVPSQHDEPRLEFGRRSDYHNRRYHPLSAFDVNTHKMLQAQLQDPEVESSSTLQLQTTSATRSKHQRSAEENSDMVDEALRSALIDDVSSQSYQLSKPLAGADVENTKSTATSAQQYPPPKHTSPHILPRTAIRPQLHHCHSFAGVLPSDTSTSLLPEGLSDSGPHNFGLLLDSLDPTNHDMFFEASHQAHLSAAAALSGYGLGIGGISGVSRSHSQPPPVAVMMKHGIYEEMEDISVGSIDVRVRNEGVMGVERVGNMQATGGVGNCEIESKIEGDE